MSRNKDVVTAYMDAYARWHHQDVLACLTDDVEFSSDNGSSWLFLPTAGTQGQVTHVRLKPRGAMAAGSNFKLSLAYKVK